MITINTRDPQLHEGVMQQYASSGITLLQDIGVEVLYTGNHHRKLAIVDEKILYEGSLNILSQSNSCEVMRRIESANLAAQMIRFLGLKRWYTK
jgi:phosphatidylserine/phosphatidylglycerophosphate/cardiolipin synthase-like enzyme